MLSTVLLALLLVTVPLTSALLSRVAALPYRPTLSSSAYARVSNNSSEVMATVLAAAGSGKIKSVLAAEKLDFYQTMTAGAISRTFAQTIMHPINTFKTILQVRGSKLTQLTPERLLRGADAQFLMSLPHGAIYFYVIEGVKDQFSKFWPKKLCFLSDFMCSTISTIICSIVSTPQMVITDRLMAGVYPNFPAALNSIFKKDGLFGFYSGWWPALAQKIPSYGLTWMFFQQFKRKYEEWMGEPPNGDTSFILGALAAAGGVCVMIPMDTVKTRLVIQGVGGNAILYKGVRDCFYKVFREEGLGAFYVSLIPRLATVVPMMAIQFGAYEVIKKYFINERRENLRRERALKLLNNVRGHRRSGLTSSQQSIDIVPRSV